MKTHVITWIVALALTGICTGQQTAEEKLFYEDYARSEQQAVAAFPDAGDAATPLAQKIAEMDKILAMEEDPLYNSSDKPLILTRKAAKQLGIKPVEAKPNPIPEPQPQVKLDGQVIPELNGYTAVTIRSLEPDGIRIMHESGASKIPIEKLSIEQRVKYGLTVEGAAEYRKQIAENAAVSHTNQRGAALPSQTKVMEPKSVIPNAEAKAAALEAWLAQGGPVMQSRWDYRKDGTGGPKTFKKGPMMGLTMSQALQKFESIWTNTPNSVKERYAERVRSAATSSEIAEAKRLSPAEQQAGIPPNRPIVLQAPVWKRFVENEGFQKANRESKANEIRRQEGQAAADRFLTRERLKDVEEGGKQNTSENYQRSGDYISINGSPTGGYRIKGDQLYDDTGKPTHHKAGGVWLPIDQSSHPQIWNR
jgi:hypothetical protein